VTVGVDALVDRLYFAVGQHKRRPGGHAAVAPFDVERVGDLGVGIGQQVELEALRLGKDRWESTSSTETP